LAVDAAPSNSARGTLPGRSTGEHFKVLAHLACLQEQALEGVFRAN
jgi:hypothetical protein